MGTGMGGRCLGERGWMDMKNGFGLSAYKVCIYAVRIAREAASALADRRHEHIPLDEERIPGRFNGGSKQATEYCSPRHRVAEKTQKGKRFR